MGKSKEERRANLGLRQRLVVSKQSRESKEQMGPTNIRTEQTGQNVESPNQYESNLTWTNAAPWVANFPVRRGPSKEA